MEPTMLITRHTRMHEIIREYGDISADMKARGVRCDGPRWLRRIVGPVVTRVLSVERAARMHGVPLETMLRILDEIGADRAAARQGPAAQPGTAATS